MPKAKQRATPKAHKHKDMDKVKIKRVKHTKKKISTKEKILGGLGLGSTLLGGAGAISAGTQPQTQFVRTTENEKSSSSSKIRSTLNKIFGIKTAQGAMTAEQDAARQMLSTGQNPDGSPASQEQLAHANEVYYGGYYNQLPNVGGNYTPEELQNIGAEGLAGAHVIKDGQGNFMGAVNRVGNTIVVTLSNGSTETFTIAQALERMGVAANDTAKNLLILSRDDGYLATIGVVQAPASAGAGAVTTDPTGNTGSSAVSVQVTGVVQIFDESGNIIALQGNYGGQRYATTNGILYDGSGKPVTNLSVQTMEAIISALNTTTPVYAIITDELGNPLGVWNHQGVQITGSEADGVLNSYHTGTQLHFSASSVPGGSIAPQTPVTPPAVNPLNNISSSTVQVTPGQYGQSWSTEGVTQAYNQALAPFQLVTQRNNQTGQVVSYTITINNGTTRTFTTQELNEFLNTTWNGGQFMNLSQSDRQIFVAAIQARLQDPNIGVGIPNLPSPNTNDAQAIHFVDSNGNYINFQQGFSPTGQSFRTDAEWVQRMFPGSRIVDAGFPGGTTSSWNPVDSGDPRAYYDLILADGSRFNIGLFLQGNIDQSNGKTIVTLTGDQAKYFSAPSSNIIPSVIGNANATTTTTTTGSTGGSVGGTVSESSGQITTSSLPGAVVGTAYNQGLSAYHSSASVRTWAVANGQLPAGMSLNSSTGFISGTPSQSGNYNFTLRVAFSNNQTAEKAFSIAVTGTSSGNIVTPPGAVANLNTWVSQTSVSVKVGESKSINVHAVDGDAVLVGSNKIMATSSNNAVVGVTVGSDSNSITITGRSVGSATVRIHPSGRTDTGGDKLIMVTVSASGSVTTTTTTDNNYYPTPISSGSGGGGGIVTTTILNNPTNGGSNYVNLPDNNSSQTITKASVSDVGDDEGVLEDGEGSGVSYVNSVNDVGDDEDVEVTEGGNTIIDSVKNVGNDEDGEVEGTEESTAPNYNQNTTNNGGNNSGNTGSNTNNSGYNYGNGSNINNLGGAYNYGSSGSENYSGINGVQTYQNTGFSGGLVYQTGTGQNAGTSAQGGVLAMHTVVKGDTLWEISRQYYGDPTLWFKIQEANMDKVPNVRQMRIGIVLVIPNLNGQGLLPQEKSSSVVTFQNEGVNARGTYKVKQGDTLWKIAKQSYGDGNLWRNILEANPNSLSIPGNTKTLKVGFVLNIPSLGTAQTLQNTTPSTITTYEQQPEVAEPGPVINQPTNSNPNINPLGGNTQSSQQNMPSQPIVMPSVSDVGDDEEVEATE